MNNSESMLNELIKGIGMTTELWMITYGSFKKQKLSDEEAIEHTKACLACAWRSDDKEEILSTLDTEHKVVELTVFSLDDSRIVCLCLTL